MIIIILLTPESLFVTMWSTGLVLLLSIATSWSAEICCSYGGCFNDNAPFSHLPLPDCPSDQGSVFNLYTRSNRNEPQTMTINSIPPLFSGARMTFFLVHGWTSNEYENWLHFMKDALLDKEDVNVVIVGWPKGSGELFYPKSASNTRAIGVEVGFSMDNIKNNGGSAASRIHCIGHSLGSHVCGHAGRWSNIGRISGMDPAGPWFDRYSLDAGLSPACASFVDVIHSHGKDGIIVYGALRAMGHMDFYPNGAGFQPGCMDRNTKAGRPHFYGWTNDDDEIVPQNDGGCSHARAHEFYVESVKNNNCFIARSRCSDYDNIPGSCSDCGGQCAIMGYGARGSGSNGLYYLGTTGSAPFCQY